MQLVKTGTFKNSSNNLCVKVVEKWCKNDGIEGIKDFKENIMQEIDASIKQCKKIDEDVKKGDKLKMICYKLLKSLLLIRYSIYDNDKKDYIAIYWINENDAFVMLIEKQCSIFV